MSCNGCRVLRKGCSESCILRPCLQWIESSEAQGYATVFAAKFFGRAGLISFLSAVPISQRPALFQSLLFEACGRTVNPVNGAVGLLWTGNWHVCQAAVETVLLGGILRPLQELTASPPVSDEASETKCTDTRKLQETMNLNSNCRFTTSRSKVSPKRKMAEEFKKPPPLDLALCLTPTFTDKEVTDSRKRALHGRNPVLQPASTVGSEHRDMEEEEEERRRDYSTCFFDEKERFSRILPLFTDGESDVHVLDRA